MRDREKQRRTEWKRLLNDLWARCTPPPTSREVAAGMNAWLSERGHDPLDMKRLSARLSNYRSHGKHKASYIVPRSAPEAEALFRVLQRLGSVKDDDPQQIYAKYCNMLGHEPTHDAPPADAAESGSLQSAIAQITRVQDRLDPRDDLEDHACRLFDALGSGDLFFFLSLTEHPLFIVQGGRSRAAALSAAERRATFVVLRPKDDVFARLRSAPYYMYGLPGDGEVELQFARFREHTAAGMQERPSPRFLLARTELIPFLSPGHRFGLFVSPSSATRVAFEMIPTQTRTQQSLLHRPLAADVALNLSRVVEGALRGWCESDACPSADEPAIQSAIHVLGS